MSSCASPLFWQWREPRDPMPRRRIKTSRSPGRELTLRDAPPWITSGSANEPFDFCRQVERLMMSIVDRCPDLAHVRVNQILVSVLQARNDGRHGLQARVTPLRFPGGQLARTRRGIPYQVQRYFLNDREFLYLMTFCLPRFLNQDFDDKLITIFHELYHISPRCNGDLRRHEGRYQLHTHSQRHYDRHMAQLARAYLASKPDPALHDFLRLNFAQLEQRHGQVIGVVVPRAKIVPLIPGQGTCQPALPAADHPQALP